MTKNKKNWVYILNSLIFIALWMLIWGSIMLWKQDFVLSKILNKHELKYNKFSSIDSLLKSEFYDQELLTNSADNMIEWALVWYVWGLADPYTVYLKEEENTELINELAEEAGFAWIWAVIEKQNDYALIFEVLKWSPAAKSWIFPLDKIYMVDEQSIENLTTDEVVQLIRWEKWTEVNLFIERDSNEWEESLNFWIPIIRDEVSIPSVSSDLFEKDGKNLLYLEISMISSHTTSLLLSEIRETLDTVWKIDGIILDLRWNSWWYLEEAVKLLWHFFPKWDILVKSKYQSYEDIEHISDWRWELWNYPIVILVDQLTASASEIIALKFQENWTKIIWMQTFWKWSIQSVQTFADWSSLKYTVGQRYSPSDINIDNEWITPDIEVERDFESYQEDWTDNQLETAKDELLKIISQ